MPDIILFAFVAAIGVLCGIMLAPVAISAVAQWRAKRSESRRARIRRRLFG